MPLIDAQDRRNPQANKGEGVPPFSNDAQQSPKGNGMYHKHKDTPLIRGGFWTQAISVKTTTLRSWRFIVKLR